MLSSVRRVLPLSGLGPVSITRRDQELLLSRIVASRYFSNAESLRKILLFLWHHGEAGGGAAKECDIAISALGRPPAFDPKTDPIVRVSIAAIRERLRSFFEGEGSREPLRLTIPKGQYRTVFTEAAAPAPEPRPSMALRSFWKPHLAPAPPNVILSCELLFFRDGCGNFYRNIFVNDLASAGQEMPARMPAWNDSLRPSYHFLAAGEVHCIFVLLQLFRELNAPVEMRNARFCSWKELGDSNLILIGSARTNRFVDPLQGENCFVVAEDRIINRDPQPGEETEYRGRRYMDGKLERLVEYALITRQAGPSPGSVVTTISGNHARVMEAGAQVLSMEERVRELLERMHHDPSRPVPAHFQVLLRVDMIDFDEEIVHIEYVTHRVIA